MKTNANEQKKKIQNKNVINDQLIINENKFQSINNHIQKQSTMDLIMCSHYIPS
jgi:hypothetical protein